MHWWKASKWLLLIYIYSVSTKCLCVCTLVRVNLLFLPLRWQSKAMSLPGRLCRCYVGSEVPFHRSDVLFVFLYVSHLFSYFIAIIQATVYYAVLSQHLLNLVS